MWVKVLLSLHTSARLTVLSHLQIKRFSLSYLRDSPCLNLPNSMKCYMKNHTESKNPAETFFFFFLMYWFSRQCVFVVLIVAGFVKAWVSFPRREMVMEKRILNIISQIWLWEEELEKFCIEPSKVCDMCGCNKSSWDPENIPVVEVRRLIKNCDPLFPDIDGGGDGQIRNPGIFSGTEELFHVWPDSWSWESTLDA